MLIKKFSGLPDIPPAGTGSLGLSLQSLQKQAKEIEPAFAGFVGLAASF
ncbi:hypothetical protein [Calothrix sp. NIES-2100]